MLHFSTAPSEARRLTDALRAGSTPSTEFQAKGAVREEKSTLQIVLEGAVLRQRLLSDGRCQTVSVYYRDDVLHLANYIGIPAPDQSRDYIMALKGTTIGSVPDEHVTQVRALAPEGQDAIRVLTCRELGISQERTFTLGTRSGVEAMAHFFCETLVRCGYDGSSPEGRCTLHISQEALGSILGVTTVNVNRTLQELRRLRLADLSDHTLTVPDFEHLAAIAQFDDYYKAI